MSGATRRLLRHLAIGTVVLVVWELGYRLHVLAPTIFGAPSLVATAAVTDGATFLGAMQVTILEVLAALCISWSLGLVIGVIAGSRELLARILAPFLAGLIAIPFIVLYPLLIAWVGIGPPSKIAFGVLLGTFPIALNVMAGVRALDTGFIAMGQAMGASRLQILIRIVVPLAMPSVIGGLRLGTSLLIAGVVLTEMLASTDGLGFWISYHRTLFNTGQVYLGIILELLITAVTNWSLSALEQRFGGWRSLQQAG